MKTLSAPVVVSLLTLSLAPSLVVPLQADSLSNDPSGVVQVTVEDSLQEIWSRMRRFTFRQGGNLHYIPGEKSGVIRFNIPEGDYKLSSAMSRRNAGDTIDRFASLEAPVHVVPGDTVSVFLTLYPLAASVSPVSLSTLKRMGIGTDSTQDYSN